MDYIRRQPFYDNDEDADYEWSDLLDGATTIPESVLADVTSTLSRVDAAQRDAFHTFVKSIAHAHALELTPLCYVVCFKYYFTK